MKLQILDLLGLSLFTSFSNVLIKERLLMQAEQGRFNAVEPLGRAKQ